MHRQPHSPSLLPLLSSPKHGTSSSLEELDDDDDDDAQLSLACGSGDASSRCCLHVAGRSGLPRTGRGLTAVRFGAGCGGALERPAAAVLDGPACKQTYTPDHVSRARG